MKEYLILGLVVLVAVAGGVIGARFIPASQLGGDFAGGIVPSTLFTASAGTNSVTPVTANLLLNGAVSVGGTAAANQLTEVFTATTTYPASTSTSVALGSYTQATSTTSTFVGFTAAGFSVGDGCEVTYTGTPTGTPFGADAFVTAVNGNAATATVTFWNGANSVVTLYGSTTPELKLTCVHTGV